MYEELKKFVGELGTNRNYKTAKDNRAFLQKIKVEAQRLRKVITDKVKKKEFDAEA
jgi:hypothetical protein